MKLKLLLENNILDDFKTGLEELIKTKIVGRKFSRYTFGEKFKVSRRADGGVSSYGKFSPAMFTVDLVLNGKLPDAASGSIYLDFHRFLPGIPHRFQVGEELVTIEWTLNDFRKGDFLYNLHRDRKVLDGGEKPPTIDFQLWGAVMYVDKKVEIARRRKENLLPIKKVTENYDDDTEEAHREEALGSFITTIDDRLLSEISHHVVDGSFPSFDVANVDSFLKDGNIHEDKLIFSVTLWLNPKKGKHITAADRQLLKRRLPTELESVNSSRYYAEVTPFKVKWEERKNLEVRVKPELYRFHKNPKSLHRYADAPESVELSYLATVNIKGTKFK